MSFFSFLSGRSVQAHEREGDRRGSAGDWGRAKIAYENALDKLLRQAPAEVASRSRLEDKIARAREALAAQHYRDARGMAEGEALEEARELARLALELSTGRDLRLALEALVMDIEGRLDAQVRAEGPILSYEEPDPSMGWEGEGGEDFAEGGYEDGYEYEDEDEYFLALIAALPEEVQQAYESYGEDFAAGYLALNDGDFETAADHLRRALERNPAPDTYIPLELATACLNLGRRREARELLSAFIQHHPDTLPGYQMLCELYWEEGDFEAAERLLAGLPPLLADSVAAWLLKGETLLRAGDAAGARALYERFMDTYGWHEEVARALARTHEALAQTGDALRLYGEMMKRCTGCGSRVDPDIKQRFADLSFAAGDRSPRLLETYLSLAQEAPRSAADCYEKISRIYADQGNEKEARRFRSFASRAASTRPSA